MVRTAERLIGPFDGEEGNTIHHFQYPTPFGLQGRLALAAHHDRYFRAFRQKDFFFKNNHTVLHSSANDHNVILRRTLSRVNGATAFWPWKGVGLVRPNRLADLASMGPRQFRRGDLWPFAPSPTGAGLGGAGGWHVLAKRSVAWTCRGDGRGAWSRELGVAGRRALTAKEL